MYYTLASLGREWAAKRAPSPLSGAKVLRALNEALQENDVPLRRV